MYPAAMTMIPTMTRMYVSAFRGSDVGTIGIKGGDTGPIGIKGGDGGDGAGPIGIRGGDGGGGAGPMGIRGASKGSIGLMGTTLIRGGSSGNAGVVDEEGLNGINCPWRLHAAKHLVRGGSHSCIAHSSACSDF